MIYYHHQVQAENSRLKNMDQFELQHKLEGMERMLVSSIPNTHSNRVSTFKKRDLVSLSQYVENKTRAFLLLSNLI